MSKSKAELIAKYKECVLDNININATGQCLFPDFWTHVYYEWLTDSDFDWLEEVEAPSKEATRKELQESLFLKNLSRANREFELLGAFCFYLGKGKSPSLLFACEFQVRAYCRALDCRLDSDALQKIARVLRDIRAGKD